MIPLSAPRARTAHERAERARALRRILGPAAGWSAEWRRDLEERVAIAVDGGVADEQAQAEALESLRAALLRRTP